MKITPVTEQRNTNTTTEAMAPGMNPPAPIPTIVAHPVPKWTVTCPPPPFLSWDFSSIDRLMISWNNSSNIREYVLGEMVNNMPS